MKRTIGTLTAVLLLALAGLALAAGGAHVKLHRTGLGKLVTNGSGFTAYMFTRDGHDKNRCVKIKFCSSTWPAVSTHGKPIAGPGIKQSLLGETKLPNGRSQVTYAGHPLYTYAADSAAGDTSGEGSNGFGAKWWLVAPSGQPITSTSSGGSPSSSTAGSTSGGGGGGWS